MSRDGHVTGDASGVSGWRDTSAVTLNRHATSGRHSGNDKNENFGIPDDDGT